MSLTSNNYSLTITQNALFPAPVSLRVTRNQITNSEKTGTLVFIALPLQINQESLINPLILASFFFKNWLCVYQSGQ